MKRKTQRKGVDAAKRKSQRKGVDPLPVLNLNAAGLDIGSAEIWAAVPADRDPEPVRVFGTFTPDLLALAKWLKACRIETVVMESTGVYWIPAFEILEARDFQVAVVNARHVKNVPGRKSDEQDCQWLQRLHTYGLLRASFRPDAEICSLRMLLRHRANLLEHRTAHIQHMQKALLQMNVQLTQVLSDITGETGLAILRRIVAGDRDPRELAELRDPRCEHSEDEIVKALTGNYRPEHVFALKQGLELYDFYTQLVRACDAQLEQQFGVLKPRHGKTSLPPLDPSDKANSHSKNAPDYDARTLLYQLVGVDLCSITGMNESTVQQALTETGTDMRAWNTSQHFCSWLHLAPANDISGGKVLRSRTLKTHNRATQAFRLAAQAASRSRNTAFAAYYRRKCARLGPQKTMTALAHKIARTYYRMLRDQVPFREMSAEEYDKNARTRELAHLRKKAARLGMQLVELTPA
jgi:transposase